MGLEGLLRAPTKDYGDDDDASKDYSDKDLVLGSPGPSDVHHVHAGGETDQVSLADWALAAELLVNSDNERGGGQGGYAMDDELLIDFEMEAINPTTNA
jgi:hypothetical protein